MRFAEDGEWVTLGIVGAGGSASASGAAASYQNVLPGVSVSYQGAPGALKEALTLTGPSAPATFKVMVGLSAGLHPSVRNGTVVLLDSANQVRFVLPAPFMQDASTYGSISQVPSPSISARWGCRWRRSRAV